jgi:quinoprotein glucose dehydrogenase
MSQNVPLLGHRIALEGRSIPEQQAALDALGSLKSPDAATLLTTWVDRLVAGKVPAPLQLDVLESAKASKNRTILAKLDAYRSTNVEALEGGDAVEGEMIFKSGQCTQCHLVNGSGGNVGPDLSHVATRLPRRDLLESIVSPNAKIAEGYATISVTTKDNDTITGTIQSQSAAELTLKDPDGQLIHFKTADIESKTAPTTAMPVMSEVLTDREIRHIVEYLSTLK